MVLPALTVGLVVSALTCFAALVIGRRAGFVDRPDGELKPHGGLPVPLGGLGVGVGLHAGLAVAGSFDLGLALATGIMLVVGMVDDRIGLGPWPRIGASVVAGATLMTVGFPGRGWVVWVGGVAMVVVLVNAVNLLDGLDALAGSVSVVVAVGLAYMALLQRVPDWWVMTVLSAAVVGFLVWNLPPARMYLGDGGAYVIGVTWAWGVLRASPDWSAGMVALAAVGVPLLDLGATVVRRLRAGTPIFGGDRSHTYDRLRDRGWSAGRIAMAFAGVQLVWVAAAFTLSWLLGDRVAAAILVGSAIGVVSVAGLTSPPPASVPDL